MKQVFIRIQDDRGAGIYFSNISNDLLTELLDYDRHPTPEWDTKLYNSASHLFQKKEREFDHESYRTVFTAKDFIFGFTSYQQFRSWLYNDALLEELDKNGFKIHLMDGEIYEGNAQAVINKSTATTLEVLTIPEFLNKHSNP